MRRLFLATAVTAALVVCSGELIPAQSGDDKTITLGPRPFFLVDGMDDGPLKDSLLKCGKGPFQRTSFSIGHRGAGLQFPEHTLESYQGATRMGAGIVECDVTFTGDGALVCRHAENDLHTTTNILLTPLANKCTTSFTAATFDANGQVITPASAECRTSDLTLAEFKSLQGKMDGFNPAARTVQEFVNGTPAFRTDLYNSRGTLMTMRESIELNERNGVKHTPELKAGDPVRITRVFGGQQAYEQRFIDELVNEGVDPRDTFAQSFNVNDILYWVRSSAYGNQAVFLVDYDDVANNILLFDTQGTQLVNRNDQLKFFKDLRAAGVKIVAPAMPALLSVANGRVVPSQLAKDLKGMGYDIITWTFERADLRQGASKAGFYFDFDPTGAVIRKDADMYIALDVLAKDVGILGIFSDWPATVTYYANCMNLK
jgi:glycerophosphoryl diester phosphodiesterase